MLASFLNKTSRHRVSGAVVLMMSLGIAGCVEPDIDRPGTWKPTGANDRNLSAMLANPDDLNHGSSAVTARGDSGARAVTRLLTDKRRQLLNVSIARIGSSGDTPTDTAVPSAGGGGSGAAQ